MKRMTTTAILAMVAISVFTIAVALYLSVISQ